MSRKGKILLPGWAGDLSPEEVEYIYRALKCSLKLRRRWGIKGSRVSRTHIRRVAVEGLPTRATARDPPQLPLFPELEEIGSRR